MNTNQSSTQAVEAPNTKLTALAWVAILVVGTPSIILRLLVPDLPAEPLTPCWLAWAQVVVLAVLWVVTWVWPIVKPLRGFVWAFSLHFLGDFRLRLLGDVSLTALGRVAVVL